MRLALTKENLPVELARAARAAAKAERAKSAATLRQEEAARARTRAEYLTRLAEDQRYTDMRLRHEHYRG